MATAKKKNNPIKVGVWGLGRAGLFMHTRELKSFPKDFEIVAGCDLEQARCEAFQKEVPNARIYTDGDAFLADKEIELVAVAVRSPQHVDYDIRALKAGKYVFAEKPVALTTKGFAKLMAAAKKYPGKLFLRHNRRFEECFNHIMEIIHSGILGDVYEIKLCRHGYDFRCDWQTLVDCGGGQLNNWGPHIIDHSLQMLEAPVESMWSDLKCIAARGDAEDHLKIVFRGTNGRIVDMEISGGVALASPVYAVYGTRGSLISPDEQDIQLKYLDPKFKMPTYPAHTESPTVGFFGYEGTVKPKWIRKTIMVEPANGARVDDIYHRVYESIRNGKEYPITFKQAGEVVRWTEEVKRQNPQFAQKEDIFGCKTY